MFYIHTIYPLIKEVNFFCFPLCSGLFWIFCLKNEYQDMTTRSAKLEFIRYLPDSREKMRRLNFHLDLTSILLHLYKKNPDDTLYFLKILSSYLTFWILITLSSHWTSLHLIFTEHLTSLCCRICFSPHKGLPMTWVAQGQNKSSIMSFGCQRKALFVYQVDKTLPNLPRGIHLGLLSWTTSNSQMHSKKVTNIQREKNSMC